MAEPQSNFAPIKPARPWRQHLWDGVLPEALGLCFVAIILAALAAGYLVADHFWQKQSQATTRTHAENLAQALATALGAREEPDEQTLAALAQGLSRCFQLRSVRWTAADGTLRLVWPPQLRAAATPPAEAQAGQRLVTLTVPVRSPTGQPMGDLLIVHEADDRHGYRTFLLLNWGGAAGLTLLAFAAFHQRLRRHLRPVAAIERSLHSYVAGVEKELLSLQLSDSLGSIARGWNTLIEQLAATQQQLRNAQQAQAGPYVAARLENTLFRRVVDRLPFGLICTGPDQRITYANPSAAALLARPVDGLVGRPAGEVIDNPAVSQAIAGAEAGCRAGLSVDHTTKDKDHESTLRFRIMPMPEPASGGIIITVEDISQLREGQRARDNFLYHVTHELRTPLTNIAAYAETLTQPGFDDEQTRKECYNVLISETRRLSRLVEDILSISQLEVGTARLDIGQVDLLRLVRQMVQDNLGAADEKGIDLTLSVPPKVPKINGDKQRLSVLLNNLIGNAVKYTPSGGKVQVSLEVDQRQVRIAVKDTGIGIAPEDAPHVFEKFYRAADQAVQAVPGTGLGLALAREVARLHGGDIFLESEKGKGSVFTLELPLSPTEAAEVTAR